MVGPRLSVTLCTNWRSLEQDSRSRGFRSTPTDFETFAYQQPRHNHPNVLATSAERCSRIETGSALRHGDRQRIQTGMRVQTGMSPETGMRVQTGMPPAACLYAPAAAGDTAWRALAVGASIGTQQRSVLVCMLCIHRHATQDTDPCKQSACVAGRCKHSTPGPAEAGLDHS